MDTTLVDGIGNTDTNSIGRNNAYTKINDNRGYATESNEKTDSHSKYNLCMRKPQSYSHLKTDGHLKTINTLKYYTYSIYYI